MNPQIPKFYVVMLPASALNWGQFDFTTRITSKILDLQLTTINWIPILQLNQFLLAYFWAI